MFRLGVRTTIEHRHGTSRSLCALGRVRLIDSPSRDASELSPTPIGEAGMVTMVDRINRQTRCPAGGSAELRKSRREFPFATLRCPFFVSVTKLGSSSAQRDVLEYFHTKQ